MVEAFEVAEQRLVDEGNAAGRKWKMGRELENQGLKGCGGKHE